VRGTGRGLPGSKFRLRIVSELREVIGALQSEAEFKAAVSGLGAEGIDRARISFLAAATSSSCPASRSA
jgi:hypothetical protein